jgi:hypothetical protein
MQPLPAKYEDLFEMLRQTQRWRPEVAKTAAFFADVSAAEYENLIQLINYRVKTPNPDEQELKIEDWRMSLAQCWRLRRVSRRLF